VALLQTIDKKLGAVDQLVRGNQGEDVPFMVTRFRTPLREVYEDLLKLRDSVMEHRRTIELTAMQFSTGVAKSQLDITGLGRVWIDVKSKILDVCGSQLREQLKLEMEAVDTALKQLADTEAEYQRKLQEAKAARRPLDHKKFLDMLIDDLEDKEIELLEGTRAHTANIDNYIKRLATALENDFNTQFYHPSFRAVREASRYWDVNLGQIETTGILANNRAFAKVSPKATMEFDLPKRDIMIAEAMNGAKAMVDDFGALVNDPSFLALAAMGSGQPTSSQMGGANGSLNSVRNVLPGLDSDTAAEILSQSGPGRAKLGSALESLIPDPAIYKFETGTGFEIRPVIQPDGQAVVVDFNDMYTTNIREPVRADEKHLSRIKRHLIDTDVQLSNYELREVSRYQVALKASRTSRGVPLLEDVPLAGMLFRPLPQQESSLQENLIMAQGTIYPTLFDLMGLRWAPAVADLNPSRLSNAEYTVRNRHRHLQNRVYDYASSKVDEYLRIPKAERRPELYHIQERVPVMCPDGHHVPGMGPWDGELNEGHESISGQRLHSEAAQWATSPPEHGAPSSLEEKRNATKHIWEPIDTPVGERNTRHPGNESGTSGGDGK